MSSEVPVLIVGLPIVDLCHKLQTIQLIITDKFKKCICFMFMVRSIRIRFWTLSEKSFN